MILELLTPEQIARIGQLPPPTKAGEQRRCRLYRPPSADMFRTNTPLKELTVNDITLTALYVEQEGHKTELRWTVDCTLVL